MKEKINRSGGFEGFRVSELRFYSRAELSILYQTEVQINIFFIQHFLRESCTEDRNTKVQLADRLVKNKVVIKRQGMIKEIVLLAANHKPISVRIWHLVEVFQFKLCKMWLKNLLENFLTYNNSYSNSSSATIPMCV